MNEISVSRNNELPAGDGVSAYALRRAYVRGFRDGIESGGERDEPAVSPAAMVFGFLCWTAMLFFVFR